MKIADKNGRQVPNGTIGEICFIPKYWRGYINQPEKTKAAYYDGWFHTGDMAFVNEDGNMVIVGRKIDIAETEDGFIVPVFIENAFRKALANVEKCHVQIFRHNSEPIVCLYYIAEKEYTLQEIRQALYNVIPEYTLPVYCQRMNEFVYYPSGKLNRNSFLLPPDMNGRQ